MSQEKQRRFLFMEDDFAVARLMQKKLERQGFIVEHAANGEDGLKMCKETEYDLVIVDHKMPIYSGLEVIRELSQYDNPPPAIMVTGAGDESTAVQALKLGARDYIVKDATSGYMELLPTVIDQVFNKILLEKEKARAEKSLRESENRYRCLVELSPDAIIVLKEDTVAYINQAGVRLLGSGNADELLGKNQNVLVHSDCLPLFEEMITSCQEGSIGKVQRFESMFTCKDGDKIDVDVMIACIDYGGKPASQLVARDITKRKRAELEVAHMNDELEQVVEEQNTQLQSLHDEMGSATQKLSMAQMATGALHNVKNVLNSLIVGTSMMSRILANSKVNKVGKVAQLLQENQTQLGTFLNEGERGKFLPNFLHSLAVSLEKEHEMILQELQGLIKNLEHIKFSIQLQLSHTRLSESSEFVSLNDVVEDALKVNASAIQRNHISVHRIGATMPPIPGNRHKVLQVLVNLISNAVNALEETNSEDRKLTLSLAMPDEMHASVTVSDNGIGIQPENLSDIFTYGFTTRESGHGFGLHSCLQLASEMGGDLTAHSEGLGEGASFTLTLPIQPPME